MPESFRVTQATQTKPEDIYDEVEHSESFFLVLGQTGCVFFLTHWSSVHFSPTDELPDLQGAIRFAHLSQVDQAADC